MIRTALSCLRQSRRGWCATSRRREGLPTRSADTGARSCRSAATCSGRWRVEGRRALGSQNGIALVAVLWVLVLLSVIAGDFLRESRTQTQLARNLLENARARALAEAGVNRAIFDLLDPKGQWQADGTAYAFPFGDGKVSVSIQDEGGKINLNRARDELLQGLFVVFDLDEEEAAHLVDANADFRDPDDLRRLNGAEESDYRAAGLPYRPKNAPFEVVDELQQVMGMTRQLYERVAPFVTVYTRRPGVDPNTAPCEVLFAIPGADFDLVATLLAERPAAVGSPEGQTTAITSESIIQQDQKTKKTKKIKKIKKSKKQNIEKKLKDKRMKILLDLAGIDRRQYIARSRQRAFTIRAEARTERAAVFVREAVVSFTRDPDQLFVFNSWKQGRRVVSSASACASADGSG